MIGRTVAFHRADVLTSEDVKIRFIRPLHVIDQEHYRVTNTRHDRDNSLHQVVQSMRPAIGVRHDAFLGLFLLVDPMQSRLVRVAPVHDGCVLLVFAPQDFSQRRDGLQQ